MNPITLDKFNRTETNFDKLRIAKKNKLYERFIPEKYANTGKDPTGKIMEFINKDIIKPIEKPKIYGKRTNLTCTKWAINTTKICTSPDKIPKIQNFKDYNFIKNEKIDVDKYRNTYFKTDNISVKIPKEKFDKSKKSFSEAKSIQ